MRRVTAYRMVALPLDPEACRISVERGAVDVVTFASPSAMEALRAALGEDLFRQLAREVPAAVMGPTTGGAVVGAGWFRVVTADAPTLEALVEAVEEATAATDGRREPALQSD